MVMNWNGLPKDTTNLCLSAILQKYVASFYYKKKTTTKKDLIKGFEYNILTNVTLLGRCTALLNLLWAHVVEHQSRLIPSKQGSLYQ